MTICLKILWDATLSCHTQTVLTHLKRELWAEKTKEQLLKKFYFDKLNFNKKINNFLLQNHEIKLKKIIC